MPHPPETDGLLSDFNRPPKYKLQPVVADAATAVEPDDRESPSRFDPSAFFGGEQARLNAVRNFTGRQEGQAEEARRPPEVVAGGERAVEDAGLRQEVIRLEKIVDSVSEALGGVNLDHDSIVGSIREKQAEIDDLRQKYRIRTDAFLKLAMKLAENT